MHSAAELDYSRVCPRCANWPADCRCPLNRSQMYELWQRVPAVFRADIVRELRFRLTPATWGALQSAMAAEPGAWWRTLQWKTAFAVRNVLRAAGYTDAVLSGMGSSIEACWVPASEEAVKDACPW
jgi:hypothetical protein